jgi:SAM-dependent methyltransferase
MDLQTPDRLTLPDRAPARASDGAAIAARRHMRCGVIISALLSPLILIMRSAAMEPVVLDIHYVPTPVEAVNKMLDMANVASSDVVYDLGCGDGRIVIAAVTDRNAKRGVGIDLDPQRIAESIANATRAGVADRVQFLQQDLFTSDLSDASVVTLYLLSSINARLIPKLYKELKPGVRIVSHDFSMADWKPDRVEELDLSRRHILYYWMLPANVSGQWIVRTSGGEAPEFTIEFDQTFQEIKGTLKDKEGIRPLGDGKIEGSAIAFTAGSGTTRFTGRVDGDEIRGEMQPSGGQPISWNATRVKGTRREIVPERTATSDLLLPSAGLPTP